jgi:hypothetical protein
MAIRGRHIRHDWQTFVDWEQKTVKGVCGVTTQRHLAGIPGFTEQPLNVPVGDKTYWGWCANCVRTTFQVLQNTEGTTMPDEVKALYAKVSWVVSPQYFTIRDQEARRRELRRQGQKVNIHNVV